MLRLFSGLQTTEGVKGTVAFVEVVETDLQVILVLTNQGLRVERPFRTSSTLKKMIERPEH